MAKRALSNVTTAELQRELERRESQVDALLAERAEFQAMVDEIDAELRGLNVAAPGKKKRGRPRGSGKKSKKKTARKGGGKRPRNEMSLVEALQTVLRGKELPLAEIIDAVHKAGYKSSSPNFKTIVNQALGTNKKAFKRVSRGVYTAK